MNQRLAFSLRLLWVLALLASLGLVCAFVPDYIAQVALATQTAAPAPLALAVTWLNNIVLPLTSTLVSLALACLLFWKKPNDAMALFLSFFLLYWSVSLVIEAMLGAQITNILFYVLFLVLLLIFPTGRFAPRWTRVLLLLALAFSLLLLTFNMEESAKLTTFQTLWNNLLLCALGIQVYRYVKVYTPRERQQIKWVVYDIALWFGLLILITQPFTDLNNLPASAPRPWWQPLELLVFGLSLNIMPISFTLAIMRSHLWDIDLIIRRTLVYTALTALLALTYWGGVVGLQALLLPITGEGNELAIVATTLAVAALFFPLRRFVQGFIDRRFYRRKYDAARTLAAFGQVARDEVDLDALTGRLVCVVEETMQPAHISIWLRPVAENRDHSVLVAAKP